MVVLVELDDIIERNVFKAANYHVLEQKLNQYFWMKRILVPVDHPE